MAVEQGMPGVHVLGARHAGRAVQGAAHCARRGGQGRQGLHQLACCDRHLSPPSHWQKGLARLVRPSGRCPTV